VLDELEKELEDFISHEWTFIIWNW
jgi:hypothetical protein